jgi:tRNA G18 (ribose-2'-O)-methylase SpoU
MKATSFEIHLCASCGLRYPVKRENNFGSRCPICLGETQVVLTYSVPGEEESIRKDLRKDRIFRAVLLDNIRSAWNVGSILRSADGFGFDHAYLCGITPTPENEAVTKTSLGAEESLPWSYHKDAVKLITGLKQEGWRIIALEEGKGAVEIGTAMTEPVGRSVLVLGSEASGVDPGLLSICDDVIAIPMQGTKRSLNVAIAFSVAAFALTKRD